MVTPQNIYSQTRGGLDIIFSYYPQAVGMENTRKHFAIRDERTPSACLRQFGDCWKVTDFGGEGKALSAIDIVMKEEHADYSTAIDIITRRFSIRGGKDAPAPGPRIERRQAQPDEKDGDVNWELEPRMTDAQLKILGPKVTQDTVDRLHWHVCKSLSRVKDRKVTTRHTTDAYPIFIRECVIEEHSDPGKTRVFYKIYEPLADKQYRFSYAPTGGKPRRYTNGLYELRKAHALMNAQEEERWAAAHEGQPYKERKLPEAFICSGERDALCCAALGYQPVWFNSETQDVTGEDVKELYKYVETLYNIPDIDDTGLRQGRQLALAHLTVHTLWLPEWLSRHKDWRGKPCKDLRDFCSLYPEKRHFNNLLTLAMPAQFWTERENQKTGAKIYDIDSDCLHYFLSLNGFHTLHDPDSDTARYIRIRGNVVSDVTPRDISRFVLDFCRERYLSRDIRNLVINSQRLGATTLEKLREVVLDFQSYTPDSQMIFFEHKSWRVTKDGVEVFDKSSPDRYVWEQNVIRHDVKLRPDFFSVSHDMSDDGGDVFDIAITDKASPLFRYLINTSRVHWRKDMEYALDGWKEADATAYREEHHFDIAAPNLTAAEIQEQKLNLISKIFAIGYILHHYKSPSRAWALYAMDNRIGDDGDCNGRSGKSFLFNTFSRFMNTVKLSGRNPRLMDNPHVFDQVDKHTDFVLVDDCDKYLRVGLFYDAITGGMTVNPKNNRSYYIDFAESPKFGFTTNYVPGDFDPSTNARLLYMVFSDYYHEKTVDNDYLESRSIRDDFGKNLFIDYTEEEWDLDINFMTQCLRFYLRMTAEGVKIQPPLGNILMRKYKADMGSGFEDWAYSYFAEESEHVDHEIVRKDAFEEFCAFTRQRMFTMQRFTRALVAFSIVCPYIDCLNPPELLNSGGRIIRKKDGQSVEMIYLRTVKTRERLERDREARQRMIANGQTPVPQASNPNITDPDNLIQDELPF